MAKDRIDKIFSVLGLLSRSECKKAVKRGEIAINGILCKTSDEKVDPDVDCITYRGQRVDTARDVYYILHKPAGYITAKVDKFQPVVFDLIDDKRTDLEAVGRLDKDTTGLLLLTNDGQLNHNLLSPKHHVPKRYVVRIQGVLTEADIQSLEKGLDIGDEKPTLPAKVELLDQENPQQVALTITEGRYHQVKRMFEAVGKPVLTLHRASFGPLELKDLPEGQYRKLTDEELELLK